MKSVIDRDLTFQDISINCGDYTWVDASSWKRITIPVSRVSPVNQVKFAQTIYWTRTNTPIITILDENGANLYLIALVVPGSEGIVKVRLMY